MFANFNITPNLRGIPEGFSPLRANMSQLPRVEIALGWHEDHSLVLTMIYEDFGEDFSRDGVDGTWEVGNDRI